MTIRSTILKAAEQCVCHDRQDAYGSVEDNFGLIGGLWSTLLGTTINAHDVALMMALLKIARAKTGLPKDDNYVDLAGYAACAGEIAMRRDEE